jgi:transglutaminase-like putative cysteine protease
MRIDHVTEYRFGQAVTLLPHRLMLRPRTSHALKVVSATLEIVPEATVRWQRDAFDNSVALATFTTMTTGLRVASAVVIEQYDEVPLDFVVADYAVTYPFEYAADEVHALAPFRAATWPNARPALEDWLQRIGLPRAGNQTYTELDRLNRAIHDAIRYEPREAPGVQSPADTLARGTGSCRDFAALFLEACRALGLGSRFVSGYLHPSPAFGAGATHAWAEVYLPGPGWKGFDPTSGVLSGADHIAVAVSHHPEHVPPIAGDFIGPADQRPSLHVGVNVQTLAP